MLGLKHISLWNKGSPLMGIWRVVTALQGTSLATLIVHESSTPRGFASPLDYWLRNLQTSWSSLQRTSSIDPLLPVLKQP